MRYRKKPWAEEELSSNKSIVLNPADNKGKWKEFFGNDKPIYVEIGCGKGQFITQMSRLYPDVNFIGVEREQQIIVTALKKSRLAEVGDNIAFICADVAGLEGIFACLLYTSRCV